MPISNMTMHRGEANEFIHSTIKLLRISAIDTVEKITPSALTNPHLIAPLLTP